MVGVESDSFLKGFIDIFIGDITGLLVQRLEYKEINTLKKSLTF